MVREIDLLTKAASGALTIVEKCTNQTWELNELREAEAAGQWWEEDQLLPGDESAEVSSPYPGCLQRIGATEAFDHYHLLGQTRHFLIFAPQER
jgi:hypothetical protein